MSRRQLLLRTRSLAGHRVGCPAGVLPLARIARRRYPSVFQAVFYPKVDEYAVLEIKGLNHTMAPAPYTSNGTKTNATTSIFLAVEGRISQGQNEYVTRAQASRAHASRTHGTACTPVRSARASQAVVSRAARRADGSHRSRARGGPSRVVARVPG
jgi:hypothetical protein